MKVLIDDIDRHLTSPVVVADELALYPLFNFGCHE